MLLMKYRDAWVRARKNTVRPRSRHLQSVMASHPCESDHVDMTGDAPFMILPLATVNSPPKKNVPTATPRSMHPTRPLAIRNMSYVAVP